MTGFVGNIEELTLSNNFFRKVIHTSKYSQLVVMCLTPGEDIGMEVHHNVDQFLRVEKGEGKVILNGKEYPISEDTAIVVVAGTNHNIVNTSTSSKLHLYTIYSPPNHKDQIIHKTKAEAMADEEDHV